MIRTLWASVQGDPVFMRKLNGWLMVFLIPWTIILAIPGSPLAGLAQSVGYVTFISHVALILGCLGAWQASRVEVKQDEQQGNVDLEHVQRKVEEVHERVAE